MDQMAEFVHQHVLERGRPPQHQRQIERERAVGRERSPLRGHGLEADAGRSARQRRQIARQPAAHVGARLGFEEIAQRAPQRDIGGALRQLQHQPARLVLHADEAAFLPAQRHLLAAQRQMRGFAAHQRQDGGRIDMHGQLLGEPVAVFAQEAFAGDQAGAHRQRQPRAALVDRQPQAPRARIAHAQDVDGAAVVESEGNGFAFETAGWARQQAR